MYKKRIFRNKKNKNNKLLFFIFLLSFILIIFYLFYYKLFFFKYIQIDNYDKIFYVIPKDKGGQKVLNVEKKSLNKIDNEQKNINNYDIPKLIFSIQFFANNNYEKVYNKLLKLTRDNENIYNHNDFYILTLFTDIGIEYFLTYKNFISRENAANYCDKYLNNLDNCYIIDVQNFIK
tara:strand:- start:1998 stop:2528 length:531 start_codon:yes stop_codon:yes gene_type:complete